MLRCSRLAIRFPTGAQRLEHLLVPRSGALVRQQARLLSSLIEKVELVSGGVEGGQSSWTVMAGGKTITAPLPWATAEVAAADQAAEAEIAAAVVGLDVVNQQAIDDALTAVVMARGGAHAEAAPLGGSCAVSMASCALAAQLKGVEIFEHVAELAGTDTERFIIPFPYMAALSGGKRAANRLPLMDIFLCPTGAMTFAEAHLLCQEVMHHLGESLEETWEEEAQTTSIGSFAPPDEDAKEALQLAFEAINQAGVLEKVTLALHTKPTDGMWSGVPGSDVPVDSGLYDMNYKTDSSIEDNMKGEGLCYFYQSLSESFPLVAMMGPFEGRDWENHCRLTNICDIQITASEMILDPTDEDGDLDGQATKEDAITSRLHQAATKAACHATLISLSSCGTVSAAIGAACQADMLDMVVVVDGLDDSPTTPLIPGFLPNFVVGLGCGQYVTEAAVEDGEPELHRIEEILGQRACLPTQYDSPL